MHIPSHQAIRFFLLSFSTGLIVLMAGALIFVTLPKHGSISGAQSSNASLSSSDLANHTNHVHGVITSLGDHLFTISTQGVTDTNQPSSVVVHYTDGMIKSVDSAQIPDPTSGKAAQAHDIDSTELHVGNTVDVSTKSIAGDAQDIYATAVLQVL